MTKATTTRRIFSRETAIEADIAAPAERVWAILTDAADYARWNSTVVSLEGLIKEGGRLQLVSSLDPNRTFKLKVKALEPERRMVWGDSMGSREFTLEEVEGKTRFSMREKIGGPFFPLFAGMIPCFDASFEQFVSDLAKEAQS